MESADRAWWKRVWKSQWLAAALLIAVTVIAYLPALRAGFIWDDDDYVTKNQTLRDLAGLRDIWFKVGAVPQYYPLVHTTFWLEYHMWGLNPFGYHLLNVVLHALAAVLLWRALNWLQIPGAWLGAAVFALHPVEVESVAWITERKNVLSAVFYFAAALTYLRFAQLKDSGASEKRPWYFYSGALLSFMAALLSKTVTASLPAALLLIRWWKKGRLSWNDFVPLLPFFMLSGAFGWITAWMEKYQVGAEGLEWSLAFSQRFLLAGRALWFYIGKLAWPSHLTFIYPHWDLNPKEWWQSLFLLAAIIVVAGLWLGRRWIGRAPVVAVLFFGGTLFPALGFVNVYPFRYSYVADHFQYLASVGLIALAAAALSQLPRAFWIGLLGLLGFLTWHQTQIYRDVQTLWQDTLAKNPQCWMAHNNLGNALLKIGKVDEAIAEYQRGIKIQPNLARSHDNLGLAFLQKGELNEAISSFQRACEINPNDAEARADLGNAFLLKNEVDEAIVHYRKALEINPAYAQADYNLGVALRQKGKIDEAVAHYQKALQIKPDFEEPKKQLRELGVQAPH
jgi:tetratricopeptide (TPR) repeat protein